MEASKGHKEVGGLRVALAGLGGVGGYCASILQTSGIGYLKACDFDLFRSKNVSYQYFASTGTVGCKKSEVTRERLAQRRDSATRIEIFEGDLTNEQDVGRLIEGADIVISALDNFSAQAAVGTACERAGIPFAMVSEMGLCCQYTVYTPDEDHSYSSAWGHFSRGRSHRLPSGLESDHMTALQSVLFAVVLAGYTDDAVSGMLEGFRREGSARFSDIACMNYLAACLGVLNALKYVSGCGRAVIFPEVVSLDMKHLRTFDGRQMISRVGELNRAWRQGQEAVMACVRGWRNSEQERSRCHD